MENYHFIDPLKFLSEATSPYQTVIKSAEILKENGFVFEDVLVRRDDVFEYLNEKTLNFRFQQEQTEIEIEDENAVFEDERIVETEDAELEAEK